MVHWSLHGLIFLYFSPHPLFPSFRVLVFFSLPVLFTYLFLCLLSISVFPPSALKILYTFTHPTFPIALSIPLLLSPCLLFSLFYSFCLSLFCLRQPPLRSLLQQRQQLLKASVWSHPLQVRSSPRLPLGPPLRQGPPSWTSFGPLRWPLCYPTAPLPWCPRRTTGALSTPRPTTTLMPWRPRLCWNIPSSTAEF